MLSNLYCFRRLPFRLILLAKGSRFFYYSIFFGSFEEASIGMLVKFLTYCLPMKGNSLVGFCIYFLFTQLNVSAAVGEDGELH